MGLVRKTQETRFHFCFLERDLELVAEYIHKLQGESVRSFDGCLIELVVR